MLCILFAAVDFQGSFKREIIKTLFLRRGSEQEAHNAGLRCSTAEGYRLVLWKTGKKT